MMRGWMTGVLCAMAAGGLWAKTNGEADVTNDGGTAAAIEAAPATDMPTADTPAPVAPDTEEPAAEEEADVPDSAATNAMEAFERIDALEPKPSDAEPGLPEPEPPEQTDAVETPPHTDPAGTMSAWERWMIHTRYFFQFTLPGYAEQMNWEWPSLAASGTTHWDIGWRFRQYSYFEDQKGEPGGNNTYFGSIYKIEDDHSFFPGMPYVQYRFTPYVGAGLTYDTLVARTIDVGDRGKPTEHKSSDGDIEMKGPALYILGRYANTTRFTPFAELGMIFYGTSFNAKGDWGTRNRLDLEDDNGIFITGGCDYQINNNFSAEIFFRRTSVKTRGTWYLNNRTADDDVNFDLGNLAYGIGAKYSF